MQLERQTPDAVVDVGDWKADEKYPIFPVGSKPKRALICPDDECHAFLRPGHRYLFKAAGGWQAQQLWSEVIAYELSRALGLEVPPALVALDSKTGTPGVLVEFFYGYPGVKETSRLVHAADFMQDHFVAGKKGRPHGLRENLALCRALKVPDRDRWWCQALVFDTLIGNTDRHPENWGFLFTWRDGGTSARLAPLYDNGTSLGYNIPDEKLAPAWDEASMAKFILRGTHDCGWSGDEDGPTGHINLTARFLAAHPSVLPEAERLLRLSEGDVEAVTTWCEQFEFPLAFSPERSHFVMQQVMARRSALAEVIG